MGHLVAHDESDATVVEVSGSLAVEKWHLKNAGRNGCRRNEINVLSQG